DLWRSIDGGVTWTSAAAAALLPPSTGSNGRPSRIGRMTLAAGNAADPTRTVLYAMVANQDETHPQTVNIFRSTDGGATWASGKGSVSNPDAVCTDMDVGSVQSGFNQAIAVDPANADHVVVAGLFCSLRTTNGQAQNPSWQVISDVYGPQTVTPCGAIPYV